MEIKFSNKHGFESTVSLNGHTAIGGLEVNGQQVDSKGAAYLIEYGLRQSLADSYALPATFEGDKADESARRFEQRLAGIVAGNLTAASRTGTVENVAFELSMAEVRAALLAKKGMSASAFNKAQGSTSAFKELSDRHLAANKERLYGLAREQLERAAQLVEQVDLELDIQPEVEAPAAEPQPKRKGKKA
jgi:hypothetical protein